MSNQAIKVSIAGLVLVGAMVYAPVASAEYEPKDNGGPKTGEDAGTHLMPAEVAIVEVNGISWKFLQ